MAHNNVQGCIYSVSRLTTPQHATVQGLETRIKEYTYKFSESRQRENMVNAKLPNLLVLRRDTATGFYAVGWDSDMPIGRFAHIEVICETASSEPIGPTHELHDAYTTACQKACAFNAPLLEEQCQHATARGWLPVPLDLHRSTQIIGADVFGSQQVCAMQTRHRLCGNQPQVWCVLAAGVVVDVRACEPPRRMEPVEFHVWQHQQRQQMQTYGDEIRRGQLIAQESGLWFCPAD